jgi:hypothetical protein
MQFWKQVFEVLRSPILDRKYDLPQVLVDE